MGTGSDLQSMLQGLMSGVTKIRLRGGLIGKVCTVLIADVLAMAVMIGSAAIIGSIYIILLSALGMVLSFILVYIMVGRLIGFAERNPHAAIFEGAELLMYEQLMLGTKENPQLKDEIEKHIEMNTVKLLPEEMKQASEPDQPESPESQQSGEVNPSNQETD